MKSFDITPIAYKIEFTDPIHPTLELRMHSDGSATITIDDPDDPAVTLPNLTEFAILLSDLAQGRGTR